MLSSRWIGNWKTTLSTVWSSSPHSQAIEAFMPHFANRNGTQTVLGWAIPGGWVGVKVWSLVVLNNLIVPSVIRVQGRTSVIVVRWTDELLCSGHKWVSQFESPCIPTEMSRLHGTSCWRPCGSFATKLNRLDACKHGKIVRWYRTQASSHSSQSVVGGRVSEAGMNTAAPDRSAVLCCWMNQG